MKSLFISILLIFGFFLPSSINGNSLGVSYYFMNALISSLAIILAIKKFNKIRVLFVFAIILLLVVNTSFSLFNRYQFGVVLIILPILFILSVDLKKIELKYLLATLNIISLILIILGFGIIFEVKPIQDFLSNNYTSSFTDLYMYMIAAKRPVGPFGTHSIAAFMYFMFFLMYYSFWLKFKKIIYLLVSFIYIYFMAMLMSFSALAFILFAILTLVNSSFLLKKINFKFFLLNISILVGILMIVGSVLDIDLLKLMAGTNNNGLISRYGEHGVLGETIDYLKNSSFLGDGIGYSENLKYTDSGFIHALLIYGVLGTIIFYILFYVTLHKNKLVLKWFVFGAILFFEIGYDVFFYTKMIFMLILVYFFLLNINQSKGKKCQI